MLRQVVFWLIYIYEYNINSKDWLKFFTSVLCLLFVDKVELKEDSSEI